MRFEEECELIGYFGKEMINCYWELEEFLIDFDYKLLIFLVFKDIEFIIMWCVWCVSYRMFVLCDKSLVKE